MSKKKFDRSLKNLKKAAEDYNKKTPTQKKAASKGFKVIRGGKKNNNGQ